MANLAAESARRSLQRRKQSRIEEEGVVVVVAVLAVEHRIAHFVLELLPKTPLAVVSAVEAFLGIETLG